MKNLGTAVFVLIQCGLVLSLPSSHRPVSKNVRHSGAQVNDRPIIGILTHAYDARRQFLPSSYVKFVESGGARVVPVFNNLTTDQYTELFHSLNGVLFPGGGVNLHTSGYFHAASTFYHLAVAAHADGDLFPIWGTCLGFQALAVLCTGEDTILDPFDSENLSLPLNLTEFARSGSKIFAQMPASLVTALSEKALTFNNHHYGVGEKFFSENRQLSETFHILSTNVGRAGKTFVSTIEGRELPFYGVQWHTETNPFMWTKKLVISHDPDAIAVTQQLSNFFVNQARLNFHQFPSVEDEEKAVIYRWHTEHIPSLDYEEIYIW